jgi:hypothetical protein
VRAEFNNAKERIDIPCTIRPDGTGLTMHPHLGGHLFAGLDPSDGTRQIFVIRIRRTS